MILIIIQRKDINICLLCCVWVFVVVLSVSDYFWFFVSVMCFYLSYVVGYVCVDVWNYFFFVFFVSVLTVFFVGCTLRGTIFLFSLEPSVFLNNFVGNNRKRENEEEESKFFKWVIFLRGGGGGWGETITRILF